MGTDMRRICSFKIKDVDRIVLKGGAGYCTL